MTVTGAGLRGCTIPEVGGGDAHVTGCIPFACRGSVCVTSGELTPAGGVIDGREMMADGWPASEAGAWTDTLPATGAPGAPGEICIPTGFAVTMFAPGADGCDCVEEMFPPDDGAEVVEDGGELPVAGPLPTVTGGLLTVTGGATLGGGLTETVADVVPPLSPAVPDAEMEGAPALTVTPVDALETVAEVLTDVFVTGLVTEAEPPAALPVPTAAEALPTPVVVLTRAPVLTGAEPLLGLEVVTEAETPTGAVVFEALPVTAFVVVVTAPVDEEAAVLTAPVAVDVVLETVVVTAEPEMPVSAHAPWNPVVSAPAAARIRAAETVPINRNSCASVVGVEHPHAGEVPDTGQFSCHGPRQRGPDRAVH